MIGHARGGQVLPYQPGDDTVPALLAPGGEVPDDVPTAWRPDPPSVPSPQVSFRELLRALPRDVASTTRRVVEGVSTVARAARVDYQAGEFRLGFCARLARHEAGRVVEPWRWVACGLVPRPVVYWVGLHAIARAVRNDEVVPSVPAMEVVARWGNPRERVVAAERSYRHDETLPFDVDHLHGLLEQAWGVIANGGYRAGGWPAEHPDWVAAAERWRDAWHEVLGPYCRTRGTVDEHGDPRPDVAAAVLPNGPTSARAAAPATAFGPNGTAP